MRIDVTRRPTHAHRLLLAVIALKPILQPQAAMAEGSFSGLQFSYGGEHPTRSSMSARGQHLRPPGNGVPRNFRNHYKLRELGKDQGVEAVDRDAHFVGPSPYAISGCQAG